jgi:hypothetical protein
MEITVGDVTYVFRDDLTVDENEVVLDACGDNSREYLKQLVATLSVDPRLTRENIGQMPAKTWISLAAQFQAEYFPRPAAPSATGPAG